MQHWFTDEDAEEALPNEVNLLSKRNELHGSHPEINPNEGGKEAYVIEGRERETGFLLMRLSIC